MGRSGKQRRRRSGQLIQYRRQHLHLRWNRRRDRHQRDPRPLPSAARHAHSGSRPRQSGSRARPQSCPGKRKLRPRPVDDSGKRVRRLQDRRHRSRRLSQLPKPFPGHQHDRQRALRPRTSAGAAGGRSLGAQQVLLRQRTGTLRADGRRHEPSRPPVLGPQFRSGAEPGRSQKQQLLPAEHVPGEEVHRTELHVTSAAPRPVSVRRHELPGR